MGHSIHTRINTALVIGIGLFAISIAVSLYQLTRMVQSVEVTERVTDEIELMSHLQLALDKLLMPANDYLITGLAAERKSFNRLALEAEELLRNISTFPLNEKEQTIMDQVQAGYERLNVLAQEIFTLQDPVRNAHGPSLMKQLDAEGHELILLLDQYHLINQHRLEDIRQETTRNHRQALRHITGSGVVLGLLALLFGVRLARSVTHPVQVLESGTKRITAGDWDYRVDVRTGDELEALARCFNEMAEKLGGLYRSLEEQVAVRTRQITDQLEDFATLFENSTALSATIELDRLLSLMAERITHTVKATYC